jgi:hypothetical protein
VATTTKPSVIAANFEKFEVSGIEYGALEFSAPDSHSHQTYYIVSTLFAQAANECRHSLCGRLLVPDSGPLAVRENGQIKYVKRFFSY